MVATKKGAALTHVDARGEWRTTLENVAEPLRFFVEGGDYADFVARRLPGAPVVGPIESVEGAVLGTHEVVHFVLSGMSKLACLPQCKLAWVAYGGPPRDLKQLDWRMEMMGRTYRSVSTVTQQALPELLRIGGELRALLLQRIKSNLQGLRIQARSSAVQVLTIEGGWYATPQFAADLPALLQPQLGQLLALGFRGGKTLGQIVSLVAETLPTGQRSLAVALAASQLPALCS